MNEIEEFEFEAILVFVTVAIPCFIKFLKTFLPNTCCKQFIIVTSSQYTNWNLCLVAINHFYNNRFMNVFLTINSSTIFIVYHIFYLTNKSLIKQIPNVPDCFNNIHIDITNVVVHVIPFIGYLYGYYKNTYLCDYNMGYNVLLFNMIWAFQCFLSFDPHSVYFKVSEKNIYKLWLFVIFLDLSIGLYIKT